MSNKTGKGILQFAILLAIGVLLIWLSLMQVAPEKDNIILAFKNANYKWIIFSMLVAFLSHFLRAFRWNNLLKPLGLRTNIINATAHVIVGYFANYGIPRMGEVTRCTLAAKYDNVPFEKGFGTVIIERVVDTLIFIIIFFLTLLFQYNELAGLSNQLIISPLKNLIIKNGFVFYSMIFSLLFSAIIIFYFRKKIAPLFKGKIGKLIHGVADGIGSVRKLEKPFQFVILSLAIWFCYFYALYLCFFSLNETSELSQKQCLTLLLFGTFGVIFAPGGLGAYPAILGGILHYSFSIDTASSFALPWLSWTSQFILIVFTGIISLIILPFYNRKPHVVS